MVARRKPCRILALDIATTAGFAHGDVNDNPIYGSIRFGTRETPDAAVFAAAMRWATLMFQRSPMPDLLLLEALLPPTAKVGQTTAATRDRLCGLQAIVLGCAAHFGCPRIEMVPVRSIRKHFINDGALPRDEAKRATIRMCRMLGWHAADDNQADALALWSYGRGLAVPELALATTPLFGRMS